MSTEATNGAVFYFNEGVLHPRLETATVTPFTVETNPFAADALWREAQRRREETQQLSEEHQRLHHAATHDALTGVSNREGLQENFAKAVAEADRTGRPFAILYIDLDNFKPLNDKFGHAAGDVALKIVANYLDTHARRGSVVARGQREPTGNDTASTARLGGDEFACIIWPTDTEEDNNENRRDPHASIDEQANGAADRIENEWSDFINELPRSSLAELDFSKDQATKFLLRMAQLGFSIGIVAVEAADPESAPETTRDLAALLRQADQQMYERKRQRKLENRRHPPIKWRKGWRRRRRRS